MHPTLKSLLRERAKLGGGGKESVAFCKQWGSCAAFECGEVAQIHFARTDLTLKYVAHEATHAMCALARMCKLDSETYAGEEALAEAVEHMVGGILCGLRKYCKIKL